METLLTILCIIAAVLLVLVVLIQPGKADMISGMGGFGGQFTNLLGVRQSRNILQSITISLAVFLVLMSIVINRFLLTDTITERAPVTQGAQAPVSSPGSVMPTVVPPAPGDPAPAPQQQGK